MPKWDYQTTIIPWDSKRKNWTGTGRDGKVIEGLDRILIEFGMLGWELVNLIVDQRSTVNGETVGYRAVFKRPVES